MKQANTFPRCRTTTLCSAAAAALLAAALPAWGQDAPPAAAQTAQNGEPAPPPGPPPAQQPGADAPAPAFGPPGRGRFEGPGRPGGAERNERRDERRDGRRDGRRNGFEPPDSRDLARARDELRQAQERLEAAAREVARLSTEVTAPVVDELRRRWAGWNGERAVLGIGIEDTQRGVRVDTVTPGGPADRAGIHSGDVIVAVDGVPLAGRGEPPARQLVGRLDRTKPGETVRLRVLQDGQPREVRVQTRAEGGSAFGFAAPARAFGPGPMLALQRFLPFGPWHDMELVSLTPQLGAYFGTDEGILVVRAPKDDTLPLEDGNVILAIGDRKPTSPEHALRILSSFEPGETLHLTIMRRHEKQTLEAKLPGGPGAGRPGAGRPGAAQPGAGQSGSGQSESGQPEAGQPGAGQPDSGGSDSGGPDSGGPEAAH